MKKLLAGIVALGLAGIVYAACAPDLIVTSVSYTSGTGLFSSVVKNRGTTATAGGVNITTTYTVDGVQRATGSVAGPLAAGASVTVGSTAYTIPDGTHTIVASADSPTSLITESQEGNNLRSTIVSISDPPSGPAAAFLGAQGGGAAATGGRGGAVMMVTNLNDSGSGSLRACVQASGPRTCIFRVAGTITLASPFSTPPSSLTVAGQSAPAGGIQLSGKNIVGHVVYLNDTSNVIWRYTKIRKGFTTGGYGSGVSMYNSNNMIIDHNTVNWNQDEGIGAWSSAGVSTSNMTISYNLIAEGLSPHSTAILHGGAGASLANNFDVHHNLMMNNSHRNPLMKVKTFRFVNNIIYNNSQYTSQLVGGMSSDIIGNLYKVGPMNDDGWWPWPWEEIWIVNEGFAGNAASGTPSPYMLGNVGWSQTDSAGDQWLMASERLTEDGDYKGAVPTAWRRASPLAATTHPIVAEPVAGLAAALTPIVGASRRLACDGTWVANRDAVDTRLINQYNTNTGIVAPIPTTETDAKYGGYPTIATGAACADADLDGMPDTWETAQGFNPNVYDPNLDSDADGYTNLEEYLNGP